MGVACSDTIAGSRRMIGTENSDVTWVWKTTAWCGAAARAAVSARRAPARTHRPVAAQQRDEPVRALHVELHWQPGRCHGRLLLDHGAQVARGRHVAERLLHHERGASQCHRQAFWAGC
jgi:hypothetical protein